MIRYKRKVLETVVASKVRQVSLTNKQESGHIRQDFVTHTYKQNHNTKMSLPTHMRALYLPTISPDPQITLRTVPVPTVVPGSVLIRVLAAQVSQKVYDIYSGKVGFTLAPDMILGGGYAIGRVVQPGPDTTSLPVGKLVMIQSFLRARDNPEEIQAVWGTFDGGVPAAGSGSRRTGRMALMPSISLPRWRTSSRWMRRGFVSQKGDGGLGYSVENLLQLPVQLVVLGGWKGIGLRAGERVIVAPATGQFGGAAVEVAVAMGAGQVIVMGRNMEILKRIQGLYPRGKIQIVPMSGDEDGDVQKLTSWGPVDAYLDISPAAATGSTHVGSCFKALRNYGRASLMGVLPESLSVTYAMIVWKSLTIKGQYMYDRADAQQIVRMAESGVLRLGPETGVEVVGRFKLDEIDEAWAVASKNTQFGKLIALTP
ncbi:uncharacterized protein PODANS_3_50 [Podospora anserina S mat+]|uniref:Podospora anserina S mat+ genomic DNA chromosome 3, supercontig 1 n=1 Tax=Podospora anserina (strain S / ATCC MYA-4624 / DSM 980 / FGSC 10383) TaxID=515849 RepID=B2AC68_PODAN|nr:uncharacterized protein PODANS_3_50 [Podospora anserina S mat+]CAP61033.1 unnamed protein product [Podospora anserina S mat+]